MANGHDGGVGGMMSRIAGAHYEPSSSNPSVASGDSSP